MAAVQRFCDRALLLEHGRPVELGDPERVGNRYLELNFSEQARELERVAADAEDGIEAGVRRAPSRPAGRRTEEEERYGDGRAEILEAWFEDEHGARAETLQTGRPCTFCATVRFRSEVEDPLFGINVQNSRRDHVLSASNLFSEPHSGRFAAGEEVTFRISFENLLAPDRYHVTPAVARHGGEWIDRRERMVSVVVTGTRSTDALLELPYRISIERGTGLDRRRGAARMSAAASGAPGRRSVARRARRPRPADQGPVGASAPIRAGSGT